MTNSLFIFVSYGIVFFTLLFFILHAIHTKKQCLKKMSDEGFLD